MYALDVHPALVCKTHSIAYAATYFLLYSELWLRIATVDGKLLERLIQAKAA